jgi:hypoxanthine phosphoribosyltransferase
MQGTCTGSSPGAALLGSRRARFANRSERRFARILDFYRLRWEYEPHTFPIRWDASGEVVESFTPDFWLPEIGEYLELTTLRQCLVTRKNRKVRRFRALYPDRRIRLLYRGDLEKLMLKFDARRPMLAAA